MVNEGDRDKSKMKFDAIIKAMDLADYVLTITSNERVFTTNMQTALTNDIIRTAKDIYIYAYNANEIRVDDSRELWKERSDKQRIAIEKSKDMLALIQLSRKVFHLKSKRIKYWGSKTKDVKDALISWHVADKKRYEEHFRSLGL